MTRSAPNSLYDHDFFAWTQGQAAALRRMPPDAFGNRVDVAHLAREIEDLGKRDLRDVQSFLARLFEHLIKIKGAPASQDVPHWSSEVYYFCDSALEAYSASMQQLLDMDAIWRKAVKRGETFMMGIGSSVSLPRSCPFELDEIFSTNFDLHAALQQLDTK